MDLRTSRILACAVRSEIGGNIVQSMRILLPLLKVLRIDYQRCTLSN